MELYKIYNEDIHKYPVVVSVPHSGRYIPQKIRDGFIKTAVLTNMDWYLDFLYNFLGEMSVTTIIANYSRYVIDLNRGVHLQDKTGDYKNTLVYTETTFGKPLYIKPITGAEIKQRISCYYTPYYEKLEELLKKKSEIFDKVLFLDMHSFFEQADEDICLSNADNITSTAETINIIEAALKCQGFTVDKNNVFKGGRLIRHIKEKFPDIAESLAIEISYEVYLEKRFFWEEEVASWDKEVFASAQNRMKEVFKDILKALTFVKKMA